jgi:hypothetical protein
MTSAPGDLRGCFSGEQREDAHSFQYPEHLVVWAEGASVRNDPVVFRLSFSGHQFCQFIEQGLVLGLSARQI